MNINRDYIINITLEAPTKGKITLKKPIVFVNTDRFTQNVYLVADTDITDLEFVLAFRDGKELIKLPGASVGANTVEFELPNLTKAGRYEAEIVATKDKEILVCGDFTFTVRSSITRGSDING